jgi:hypothetical protein
LIRHTRQDDRQETLAALRAAGEGAAAARALLDQAVAAGVDRQDGLWAHLDLACRTVAFWAEVGAALDTAVRLLKFPAAGDEALRDETADRLAQALAAWDDLRAAWSTLLARTTFPDVAERGARYRFDDDARRLLAGMLDDLRLGRRRTTALPAPGE